MRSTTTSSCRSPTAAWLSRPPRCWSRTCGAIPTGTGSRPPTRCTPSTWPRRARCSPPRATRSRTACASNKQGKPIVLRLWTRSTSDSSQSAGKLIAGWFDKLGLKITLSVMDDGVISDGIYNMKGSTFTPNYDMFLWGWGGDPDPNFIMSIFTTDQINSWSDCAWSDPQYDKLFLEQQTTVDPTQAGRHRPPDGADHLPAIALHPDGLSRSRSRPTTTRTGRVGRARPARVAACSSPRR